MSRGTRGTDHAQSSPEVLRQSRRDRWASPLAALVATTHSLAGLCVLGWYYYIVPHWKQELEGIGYEISRLAVALIRQSDLVVNYWYLMVIIGPPTLAMDFLLTKWMAKQIGLRWAIVYAACVTLTLLCNIAYGQFLLHQTAVLLIEHVSIYGPAPITY